VIARLLEGGPILLATGGGAFMRDDTRQRIHDKAISLWLKADADVILRRVKKRENRPLLKTPDPAGTIARLIEARHPFYEQTDITIDSRDVPHEKIVDEAIVALHEHLFRPHTASALPTPAGDPLSPSL
jgi:shikimate kinase